MQVGLHRGQQMPGLELCAAGLRRQGSALFSEKGNKAAPAQARIYLRRGAVTFAISARNRDAHRQRSWLIDRRSRAPVNQELTMILTRRVFSGAAFAALLVTAGSFSSAFAATPVPFSAEAFKAAQASDKPILVEIHADWCPTCKAQDPILDKLTAEPKFRNLKIF